MHLIKPLQICYKRAKGTLTLYVEVYAQKLIIQDENSYISQIKFNKKSNLALVSQKPKGF